MQEPDEELEVFETVEPNRFMNEPGEVRDVTPKSGPKKLQPRDRRYLSELRKLAKRQDAGEL